MSDMNQGPATGSGQTQPGWYPDPTNGQLRWWDGNQWGQFQSGGAPAAMPVAGATNSSWSQAAMAHYLGAGLLLVTCWLGWVGPLIIRAGQGANDPFVRDQATEALNFQITIAIAAIISSILVVVVIGMALLPIVWLAGVILGFVGGQAAAKGETYRYPFAIRLVN